MPYDVHDTIAATATAAAGAARGVVRLAGPRAVTIAEAVFRPADAATPLSAIRAPSAVAGELLLGNSLGAVPAEALVWPSTRSYARQPTVEWHTFGSQPLLEAALQSLIAAGARLAEPGEFTLRAFLAGRLDLTQAEAVLGVIDAGDRRALDTALAQLAGGLATPLAALRGRLLDVLAHLEAGLDFVEDDIEFLSSGELQAELAEAAAAIDSLARQMQSRGGAEATRRVVIVGWPNVGKSSLLNALAGSEAALVSPTAGATRDYVAFRAEAGGMRYELIDTAGVCEAPAELDTIDRRAQEMTRGQMERADLQLLCLDSTREPNDWERRQLAQHASRRLTVLTKCDRPAAAGLSEAAGRTSGIGAESIWVSSVTGAGLDTLRASIARQLADENADASVVAGTAERCRESLLRAAEAMALALQASESQWGEEVVAAELRLALEEIGKVAGAVYTDDVLDRIFSRFCIGK